MYAANQELIDEMWDLLKGLKIVREELNKNNDREAHRVLEVAGHKLTHMINSTKVLSRP